MELYRFSVLNKIDVMFQGELICSMTPHEAIKYWQSTDYDKTINVESFLNCPNIYLYQYMYGEALQNIGYVFAIKHDTQSYYADVIYSGSIDGLISDAMSKGYVNFVEQQLFKKIENDKLVKDFVFAVDLNKM